MWMYIQISGKLINPAGSVVGIGYAGGACGDQPLAVNSPADENQEGIGPLPAGNYIADWQVQVHPRLGNFVIHLEPDALTTQRIISYGRDPASFFMHGDNVARAGQKAASDGCIVMSLDVRQGFWGSPDHGLLVVSGEQTALDQEIVS
jgi:hypothetical protein